MLLHYLFLPESRWHVTMTCVHLVPQIAMDHIALKCRRLKADRGGIHLVTPLPPSSTFSTCHFTCRLPLTKHTALAASCLHAAAELRHIKSKQMQHLV